MKIVVQRTTYTQQSTIGELLIDGKFFCYTLEDCMREVAGEPVSSWKVYGKTAIPQGTYRLIKTFSNRFQRVLPLITPIEGFSGIRVHPINTSLDTEGCLGLGYTKVKDFIGKSRLAVADFMDRMGDEEHKITVVNI